MAALPRLEPAIKRTYRTLRCWRKMAAVAERSRKTCSKNSTVRTRVGRQVVTAVDCERVRYAEGKEPAYTVSARAETRESTKQDVRRVRPRGPATGRNAIGQLGRLPQHSETIVWMQDRPPETTEIQVERIPQSHQSLVPLEHPCDRGFAPTAQRGIRV